MDDGKYQAEMRKKRIMFWSLFVTALVVILIGWLLFNKDAWRELLDISGIEIGNSSAIREEINKISDETERRMQEYEQNVIDSMQAELREQQEEDLTEVVAQELIEEIEGAKDVEEGAEEKVLPEAGSTSESNEQTEE